MEAKQYKFSLVSIDELGFCYYPEEAFIDKGRVHSSFSITFMINYDWNIEKDLIGIVLDVRFTTHDKGKEVLRFKSRCNFIVEGLDNYIVIRDPQNDFDMDNTLETTLMSISISTTRGMLFERTRGTVIHPHIIPLMDPKLHLLSELLKQQSSEQSQEKSEAKSISKG